jgi:hypothetical protein
MCFEMASDFGFGRELLIGIFLHRKGNGTSATVQLPKKKQEPNLS